MEVELPMESVSKREVSATRHPGMPVEKVMLSQTSNSVRIEDAGSHQCGVSSQSESADVMPAPH